MQLVNLYIPDLILFPSKLDYLFDNIRFTQEMLSDLRATHNNFDAVAELETILVNELNEPPKVGQMHFDVETGTLNVYVTQVELMSIPVEFNFPPQIENLEN